jgi:hypothetical protein
VRDRKSPHTIVTALQAGDQTLTFSGTAYRGKANLGTIREKRWYRVRLWLPAGGGDGTATTARADLTELTGPGASAVGRSPLEIATVTPPAAYGILELVTAPGKRDFRLYLDALSVSRE